MSAVIKYMFVIIKYHRMPISVSGMSGTFLLCIFDHVDVAFYSKYTILSYQS